MNILLEQIKLTNIPSFSLTRQNRILQKELVDCFLQVVNKGIFILDENVKVLENMVSSLCEVDNGIGVASGSDALNLSLMACDIGYGDEVITTPFTFIATAAAISRVGAKPVFVDIDPDTWNINADLLKKRISTKTKAIIPVHLYGCPAEMTKIAQVAKEHRLKIIEDAAQALGAKCNDKSVGSFGDTGCFSFFPTKNFGSFGDGGMVITDNAKIADKIKLLRLHGAKHKYHHDIIGYNSRLDELQAAILNVKFKYIKQWTIRRREIAELYSSLFQEHISACRLSIKLPLEPDYAYHVYHQYTIQTDQRNQLQNYLKNCGISSTVYYPIPIHLQKAYSSLGYCKGDFPIAEAACNQVLSLPMFPELKDEEVAFIVERVVDFFA
ncbi:DegT/DnrJ/EryC1/StrS family aminotransferase [Alkaliphilus peptidifermentans]|uniref:dTDP-4-amino-4,6-dideoxygalactose transaminase n=1 Tax=Alkaliphilus peptidifermentans DSM 18978 TaxID=1120976 RepID=A0A1G5H471_9FIRM|nr:DegT/DnrJ/EryC1/StrS family aminotransferase [Alkaliphilus peptidifermentans]SCY57728.1 dTDP-4-amino-4,6-dideoxygalactose transaminase [Alkaliphilus peptidifermentans DSM 18978]